MFRFFLAGFFACLIGAELWYLLAQLIHGADSVGIALNFLQALVIGFWIIASSREAQPNTAKWWSAIAGWLCGTAVFIVFRKWGQPTELISEFLRLGFTVLVCLVAQWFVRRKDSRSKAN
jgi:hypothetical protein